MHVRTFTLMFHCGYVKGKYQCLSVVGFLCSLYGSDGMIWSLDTFFYTSDDAARAKTTRVNVHVLYVN